MAFDIYGNNLRSGYCEVHPDVHEEYPCSECLNDNPAKIHEQQYQEYCESQAVKKGSEDIKKNA